MCLACRNPLEVLASVDREQPIGDDVRFGRLGVERVVKSLRVVARVLMDRDGQLRMLGGDLIRGFHIVRILSDAGVVDVHLDRGRDAARKNHSNADRREARESAP